MDWVAKASLEVRDNQASCLRPSRDGWCWASSRLNLDVTMTRESFRRTATHHSSLLLAIKLPCSTSYWGSLHSSLLLAIGLPCSTSYWGSHHSSLLLAIRLSSCSTSYWGSHHSSLLLAIRLPFGLSINMICHYFSLSYTFVRWRSQEKKTLCPIYTCTVAWLSPPIYICD